MQPLSALQTFSGDGRSSRSTGGLRSPALVATSEDFANADSTCLHIEAIEGMHRAAIIDGYTAAPQV